MDRTWPWVDIVVVIVASMCAGAVGDVADAVVYGRGGTGGGVSGATNDVDDPGSVERS